MTSDERLEVHVQEGVKIKKNEIGLIIDVHASHKTDRVLDELRGPIPCTDALNPGRGAIVRYVAPGTTGKCQVEDVGVNKYVKTELTWLAPGEPRETGNARPRDGVADFGFPSCADGKGVSGCAKTYSCVSSVPHSRTTRELQECS